MCISLRHRLWGSRLLALALPVPPTDFHVLGEMYLQNIKCLAGLRLKLLGQHYIASVTIIILESVFITRSNLMGEACATLRRDAVHRAASSVSCFSCNTGSGELSVGVGRELRDWGVMRVAWPPTRVTGFSPVASSHHFTWSSIYAYFESVLLFIGY